MLWVGLEGARTIVVLLGQGVSASNADWSEQVGEAGGAGLSSSVAVSISLLGGDGRRISGGGAEHLRGAGAGRLGHSLTWNRAV